AEQLAKAARHHAEAAAVLNETGEADLAQSRIEDNALSLVALGRLSRPRQANVIRYWLRHATGQVPPERALEELLEQVRRCPSTRHALVRWRGAAVERYRDRLRIVSPAPLPDPEWEADWDLATAL